MSEALPSVRSRAGVLAAALVGVVGVAGSYALVGTDPTFVAAPVNTLVVTLMPAPVVTFSILVLGEVGDALGFLLALALSVALLGVVALAAFALGRRYDTPVALAATFLGGWATTAVLTAAPRAALGAAVPMAVAVGLLARRPNPRGGLSESRRSIVRLLGVAGFVGLAYVVGERRSRPSQSGTDPPLATGDEQAAIDDALGQARAQSLDVEGLAGLVSPIGEFYEVDIDTVNPAVDAETWTLTVRGEVAAERTYSYDDLTARPSEHRFSTLRCVGEPLNGELMDNALWTGVPVDDLLADAGVDDAATHVRLRAADDYYETFPLSALRGGLLAYGMNGRRLPRGHGHPLRALVPGHWGEVNVKWLTAVELLEREAESYWESRGWHGTGPVNTVAKLHVQNRLDDGRVQVAGHAYAGTRGIAEVEVSTDGGRTWDAATLSAPLPGDDVWRQWAYAYHPPEGAHDVVVRAVDGTGAIQPREEARAFPNGASGWVSKRVRP